jgi:hypothetical protein
VDVRLDILTERVPIYAISSFVSLSSRLLAEGVELIRDVYEAVVIYTFFHLLLNYLGGQRALLNLLQDRLRIHHLWPLYFCFRPMNVLYLKFERVRCPTPILFYSFEGAFCSLFW